MWGAKKPIRRAKGTQIDWVKRPATTPRRADGPVVWLDPEAARARLLDEPARYTLPSEVEWQHWLPIGALVVTLVNLGWSLRGKHPFAVLELTMSDPVVGVGTVLIFTGKVRSVERKWDMTTSMYLDVQVWKHTFVSSIGRFIVNNIDLVRPV
jgi:hypothetical protein